MKHIQQTYAHLFYDDDLFSGGISFNKEFLKLDAGLKFKLLSEWHRSLIDAHLCDALFKEPKKKKKKK